MSVIIDQNIELKSRNTFGIAATAKYFAEFASKEDLFQILGNANLKGMPWYVISGGSNILLTEDFDGLILHPIADNIEILNDNPTTVTIKVDAGVDWDYFVNFCVEREYYGIENLSLIPGYVGASVIQNIGAYGVEVKNTVQQVEIYMVETGEIRTIKGSECKFDYRFSIFKEELKGKAIVLSVTFELSHAPQYKLDYGDVKTEIQRLGGVSLKNVRTAIINIRENKLPNPKILGNSGSFFKNPIVGTEVADGLKEKYPDMPIYPASERCKKLAAGWLIDKAGWKGRRIGDAGVHSKQALVLVNHGEASGSDILSLAKNIIADVQAMFVVDIEMEVNILGSYNNL